MTGRARHYQIALRMRLGMPLLELLPTEEGRRAVCGRVRDTSLKQKSGEHRVRECTDGDGCHTNLVPVQRLASPPYWPDAASVMWMAALP